MIRGNNSKSVPARAGKRQKPVRRGAVSKRSREKKPVNLALYWVWFRAWFGKGALVLTLTALLVSVGYAINTLMVIPVSRVVVNGDFRQIDKQLIVKEVQPFLGAGFIKLDLSGIREQLQAHPWIYRVEVVRQWPNEISIFVEEQTVIARWGESGFINKRGMMFMPEKTHMQWIEIDRLPLLNGPKDSAETVMSHFRELSDALSQYNMVLNELTLSPRGAWSARLQGGTHILFGAGDVMAKTRRFLRAYQEILVADFNKVDAIDMRYSLGFAVSWRKGDTTQAVSMR